MPWPFPIGNLWFMGPPCLWTRAGPRRPGNIGELSPAREHPTSAGAERGEAGRGEAGRGEVGACVAPACCVASHGVTGPDMLAVT